MSVPPGLQMVSLGPKMMHRNITHFLLSRKKLTSTKTKNMEEESKKEKACSSPGMLTAKVWYAVSYKALFASLGNSVCLKFRSHS